MIWGAECSTAVKQTDTDDFTWDLIQKSATHPISSYSLPPSLLARWCAVRNNREMDFAPFAKVLIKDRDCQRLASLVTSLAERAKRSKSGGDIADLRRIIEDALPFFEALEPAELKQVDGERALLAMALFEPNYKAVALLKARSSNFNKHIPALKKVSVISAGLDLGSAIKLASLLGDAAAASSLLKKHLNIGVYEQRTIDSLEELLKDEDFLKSSPAVCVTVQNHVLSTVTVFLETTNFPEKVTNHQTQSSLLELGLTALVGTVGRDRSTRVTSMQTAFNDLTERTAAGSKSAPPAFLLFARRLFEEDGQSNVGSFGDIFVKLLPFVVDWMVDSFAFKKRGQPEQMIAYFKLFEQKESVLLRAHQQLADKAFERAKWICSDQILFFGAIAACATGRLAGCSLKVNMRDVRVRASWGCDQFEITGLSLERAKEILGGGGFFEQLCEPLVRAVLQFGGDLGHLPTDHEKDELLQVVDVFVEKWHLLRMRKDITNATTFAASTISEMDVHRYTRGKRSLGLAPLGGGAGLNVSFATELRYYAGIVANAQDPSMRSQVLGDHVGGGGEASVKLTLKRLALFSEHRSDNLSDVLPIVVKLAAGSKDGVSAELIEFIDKVFFPNCQEFVGRGIFKALSDALVEVKDGGQFFDAVMALLKRSLLVGSTKGRDEQKPCFFEVLRGRTGATAKKKLVDFCAVVGRDLKGVGSEAARSVVLQVRLGGTGEQSDRLDCL